MAKDVNGNEIKAGMKVKRVDHGFEKMNVGNIAEVERVKPAPDSDSIVLKDKQWVDSRDCGYHSIYFEIVPTPETQKAETVFDPQHGDVIETDTGEKYEVAFNKDEAEATATGHKDYITVINHPSGYQHRNFNKNDFPYSKYDYTKETLFYNIGLERIKAVHKKNTPAPHAFKVGDRVRLTGRPCFLGEDIKIGDIVTLKDDISPYHSSENGYNKTGRAWRATFKEWGVCHVFEDDIEKLPDDKPSEGAKFLDRYGNELKVGDRIKVIDKTFLNIKGEETYITRLENDCGRLKIWSKDKEGESYCTLKEFDGRYELLRGGKHFNQVIWDDFVPKHWSADYDVVEGKTALELYNEEKNHKSLAVKSLYF